MRARAITTMSRRRRNARRRRGLALAGGVCALMLTASASAEAPHGADYSSLNSTTGGSHDSSQSAGEAAPVSGGGGLAEAYQERMSQAGEGDAVAAGHAHRTPTELGQTTDPIKPSGLDRSGASGQPAHAGGYSLYDGPMTPNAVLGPDGVVEPLDVIGPTASQPDGFDWGSAAVGAGAAMALVALGGATLLALRRRTAASPAA
jgi:hypothetical protein